MKNKDLEGSTETDPKIDSPFGGVSSKKAAENLRALANQEGEPVEVFNNRVINHYEISKGKYKIKLVCDGGSSGGIWGVSHQIHTKKDNTVFDFRHSIATRIVAELLTKAAEIMENEPSD